MYTVFEKLVKEKGIRVSDVSKATGIPRSAFSDWKQGRYTPKADKLQKIADYFGVSVKYLMTGEQPQGYYFDEETARMAQELFENKDLRVLFSAARTAKAEDLKTTYDMLMALKRKEGYDGDDPA